MLETRRMASEQRSLALKEPSSFANSTGAAVWRVFGWKRVALYQRVTPRPHESVKVGGVR